jgi:hypothetical protein
VSVTITLDRQHPGTGRIRRGFTAARSAAARAGALAVTPHKAALRRLAEMPLTAAAVPCVDFAAFHIAHGWGWLVTGLSLVVLEHLIADEG